MKNGIPRAKGSTIWKRKITFNNINHTHYIMTTRPLKYLIAGTGGVGGSIAAFLSLAGKDVTCIARGEHLAAIRGNGLQLHSDLKGEYV